ncbi:DUF4224 domain-containing protein [Comamonas aquatilis]|uniref:hypothetical protein n=1 Tax=Comamonas aquatilis TaxID=1778406 RepID=UPI0039EE3E7C
MEAVGEFLRPQEIKRMASACTIDEQEAFLKKEGIPHKRIGKRILVSRAQVREWLTGVIFTPSRGINLGAVR